MIDHDGDKEVLAAMAQHGADLTKPAHTIHYLYFTSREIAERAGERLRSEGFTNVRIHAAPGQSLLKRLFGKTQYSCIAETTVVPSEANVFSASDRMNKLAGELHGVYDGWEAAIVK